MGHRCMKSMNLKKWANNMFVNWDWGADGKNEVSADWRTRENRWEYSVLFFLQVIRCLIKSALFTNVWNRFSFSILCTISALQHTGGIAISSCCATGGTLHTWDGRISLDLKQVSRCTSTQAQSGHNANLWCESEACSISQNQNIFK